MDVNSGQSRSLAADIRYSWWGTAVSWAPDGSRLAYLTSSPAGATEAGSTTAVVIDVSSGARSAVERLPVNPDVTRGPLWNPSSRRLVGMLGAGLWHIPLDGGAPREIARLPDRRITAAIASVEGGAFWSTDEGRTMTVYGAHATTHAEGIWSINLDTGATSLVREDAVHLGGRETIDVASGGRVVFVRETVGDPPAVWTSRGSLAAPLPVAKAAKAHGDALTGTSRVIAYRSLDGRPLNGALLLPAGYQEGRRYPLIARVYSGIRMSNRVNHYGLGERGAFNVHLFATRGYAVFLPDMPSRGPEELRDTIRTVMPGVEKLIDLGIADPERLGVFGHSNGGYTVFSLLVQTTRFKAAAESDGQADLISAYGSMRPDGSAFNTFWLERGPHGLGGTPWDVL